MSTLIAYMTTHGCTEKVVQTLENGLNDNVEIVTLKKKPPRDLSGFDTVIIGGSIHMGKIQQKVNQFCRDHLDTLKQKRLGLFLCCMYEGDTAQKQFDDAFPSELREHAAATGLFGGAYDFSEMNFLQKAVVKKVENISESVSRLKEDNIQQFTEILNKK